MTDGNAAITTLAFNHILVAGCLLAWIAAVVVGWRFSKSPYWVWIDVAYYPLAAFGIALLFHSSDVQRERVDTAERLEQHAQALHKHALNKPELNMSDASTVLTAQVQHIRIILGWADACKPDSLVSQDARCVVVARIRDPVIQFLRSAEAEFLHYEDRLLSTCEAGNELVNAIRVRELLPEDVMGEFARQWNAALEKN